VFLHSPEAHVIDLVEIIDIVVVIRFVAVDFIPRKSITRPASGSKAEIWLVVGQFEFFLIVTIGVKNSN